MFKIGMSYQPPGPFVLTVLFKIGRFRLVKVPVDAGLEFGVIKNMGMWLHLQFVGFFLSWDGR